MTMKVKEPKFTYQSVLLIDDNDLDNFINQKVIESAYFAKDVYMNTSARSAIEFLENLMKTSVGEELLPDVLFVDINMPVMDGFQFVSYFEEKLLSGLKRVPEIVILTSSLSPTDEERSKNCGVKVHFLRKPLTVEMLKGISGV